MLTVFDKTFTSICLLKSLTLDFDSVFGLFVFSDTVESVVIIYMIEDSTNTIMHNHLFIFFLD